MTKDFGMPDFKQESEPHELAPLEVLQKLKDKTDHIGAIRVPSIVLKLPHHRSKEFKQFIDVQDPIDFEYVERALKQMIKDNS